PNLISSGSATLSRLKLAHYRLRLGGCGGQERTTRGREAVDVPRVHPVQRARLAARSDAAGAADPEGARDRVEHERDERAAGAPQREVPRRPLPAGGGPLRAGGGGLRGRGEGGGRQGAAVLEDESHGGTVRSRSREL